MRVSLTAMIEQMSKHEPNVNSDESISWQAHRIAEKLDDVSIVAELNRFLVQKPKREQRAAAYFIIGKIGKNCLNPDCASHLIAHLNTESDKYVLSSLLDRLAEIPKPEHINISPIFSFLKDKRWLVRHSAIRALEGSSSPEAEYQLLELLKNTSDPYDIVYCHSTLNKIGTSKALPALSEGLKSRKRDIKLSARAAIDAIDARHAARQTAADGRG